MKVRPNATLMLLAIILPLAINGCTRDSSPRSTTPQQTASQAASGTVAPEKRKQPEKTVIVFAGAASKPALAELGPMYEAKTGVKISMTFGGSGTVLALFSREHYGDVYIPGSDDFTDKAEKEGAVFPETRTPLVYLVPAICVAKGNPKKVRGLDDLARKDVRVVLAQPKSVCLGDIAQAILTETGLWSKVEPRVVSYATSCEDTLNHLLLGEADAIIGWDVFARQNPEKVEMIALPRQLARSRYIAGSVIKWSKQPEEAKAFINYLNSPDAKAVWAKHGYTINPPS